MRFTDLIEMNQRKDNCLYSLHADEIVSLDLDFKKQFGNRLLLSFVRSKNLLPMARSMLKISGP